MSDRDAYIKVTSISGQGRVLKRNAYIYSTSTRRTTHKGAWKLYKGSTVTIYGGSYKFKNSKRYYRIGGPAKQYVRTSNFKNTKTKKAYYWINKSGKVVGIRNYAKVISQLPEMPTGCEITAVTMMINFAGKKVTKQQAAKIMPRSSNSNKGFIGSPYKKYPLGYWVAPNGVKPVVKHYIGRAKNMTNCGLPAIKDKLINSHLVVAWVGMFDGISNHAITLTGYHGKTIYYNDLWTGTKRKIKQEIFATHWALDAHRALSY